MGCLTDAGTPEGCCDPADRRREKLLREAATFCFGDRAGWSGRVARPCQAARWGVSAAIRSYELRRSSSPVPGLVWRTGWCRYLSRAARGGARCRARALGRACGSVSGLRGWGGADDGGKGGSGWVGSAAGGGSGGWAGQLAAMMASNSSVTQAVSIWWSRWSMFGSVVAGAVGAVGVMGITSLVAAGGMLVRR